MARHKAGRQGKRWGCLGLLAACLLLGGCAAGFFTAQGQQALQAGQYQAAMQAFTAALVENPRSVAALTGLGIAYYKTAAYRAAIETLEEAKGLDADNPEARLYLGLAYLRSGQDARAREELLAYAQTTRRRVANQIAEALAVLEQEGAEEEAVRTLVALTIEDWAYREQEMQALERRLWEATAFGRRRSGIGFVIRLR
ncbi:MAG: hypothetical protein KatS3mg131_2431 [Candidatus Tectimicrobiota bacterium]|nr:MAG: hypothetical protein KatS3mg131_2431 [Candidatus Tectomicrobia bacterium]